MRRFRFVGDPDEYNWDEKPIVGDVYTENHFGTKNGIPYKPLNDTSNGEREEWVSYPEDWQEVFEDQMITDSPVSFTPYQTPLHKDTDLGYYAGLAMQGLISNPNTAEQVSNQIGSVTVEQSNKIVSATAIQLAKELIKQLDKEVKCE